MTSTPVNAGYWYCKGHLQPANINSSLFTHLFAAFADVVINTPGESCEIIFPIAYADQFRSFADTVKIEAPNVKALLSIGGDTDPSIFATIASIPRIRETFIASSIHVAREFNYDGLSLNWQYPKVDDQTNLANLLTEWKAAVETEAQLTGKDKLLLTAAVCYSPQYYPIDAINASLDWIKVMAYDLKTPVSSPNSTVPPAPLQKPTNSPQIISVEETIDAWITAGVPASTLVLGLPFYGRSWLLVSAANHKILSPASGPATAVSDPIPYRLIEDFLRAGRGIEVIDYSYVTQYGYVGRTWIGYDGKDTIFDKVVYAKNKELLGYFAWHVDGDNYNYWTLSTLASLAWNRSAG